MLELIIVAVVVIVVIAWIVNMRKGKQSFDQIYLTAASTPSDIEFEDIPPELVALGYQIEKSRRNKSPFLTSIDDDDMAQAFAWANAKAIIREAKQGRSNLKTYLQVALG